MGTNLLFITAGGYGNFVFISVNGLYERDKNVYLKIITCMMLITIIIISKVHKIQYQDNNEDLKKITYMW